MIFFSSIKYNSNLRQVYYCQKPNITTPITNTFLPFLHPLPPTPSHPIVFYIFYYEHQEYGKWKCIFMCVMWVETVVQRSSPRTFSVIFTSILSIFWRAKFKNQCCFSSKHANKEIDGKGNPSKQQPSEEPEKTNNNTNSKKKQNTKETVTCDVCGLQFDTVTSAIQHKFRKHPESSIKFYCPYCGMQFPLKVLNNKNTNVYFASQKRDYFGIFFPEN